MPPKTTLRMALSPRLLAAERPPSCRELTSHFGRDNLQACDMLIVVEHVPGLPEDYGCDDAIS